MKKIEVSSYVFEDVTERERVLFSLSLTKWMSQLTDGKPDTIKLAQELDTLRRKVEE